MLVEKCIYIISKPQRGEIKPPNMANNYTQLDIQLVFAVKGRQANRNIQQKLNALETLGRQAAEKYVHEHHQPLKETIWEEVLCSVAAKLRHNGKVQRLLPNYWIYQICHSKH